MGSIWEVVQNLDGIDSRAKPREASEEPSVGAGGRGGGSGVQMWWGGVGFGGPGYWYGKRFGRVCRVRPSSARSRTQQI